ncbi:hypothetical protein ONO86_03645 [Micromonospora noduli]|uniref:hypothetical protein n=1 Tax=Micromonospora noduli TaxID=709876 RepID=UPI000DC21FBF|nr:hypothetical protein [Micromonospora noduli]RAO44007.1 hypothetical protein ONO86_03645 [Micromonospora noduli]
MLTGTSIVAFQAHFTARSSGLVVPANLVPQPLDVAAVYITGDELFGFAPSIQLAVRQLRRLPFVHVLEFVAEVLKEYRKPGVTPRQADLKFAERWLANEALTRAKNLLRDPSRRLVVPQGLYVLVKLAAFYSPDALLPGVSPGVVVAALYGALEALDSGGEEVPEEELVISTNVGRLGSYVLANQHFNKPCDEDHLMARFVRQWLELPAERASESAVVDLEQAFNEATGVPLRDVLVVAVAVWAATLNGTARVSARYFSSLKWDEQRLRAALQLFTADIEVLRGGLRGEARNDGIVWAFDTLGQYPAVLLNDGSVLVLDAHLLARRIFGGLTLYDISSALKERGDRASKKRAHQVESCVRHLAEVYALEVLNSVTSSSPACPRVFDSDALLKAFQRKSRRVADAVVDYGDAWVVVEITTTKLKRESVTARSEQSLSDDLDKLVKEVEQIDHTIAALRNEEAVLTGLPTGRPRRFFPLLVLAEGFPVNPISTTLLRERVKQSGLLAGKDVAPLELIDTVELEMIEALQEQGGPSMRDVLEGKQNGNLYRSSMRDYLIHERRFTLRRSERVSRLMHKAWTPALAEFKPTEAA